MVRSEGAFGVLRSNVRGRFLQVDRTCCETIGRRVEDLAAMGWEDIVHPDDWAIITSAMAEVLCSDGGRPEALVRVVRPEATLWTHVQLERATEDGVTFVVARVQPFLEFFRDSAESHNKGIDLLLDAVSLARADRDVMFDALEDMRTRIIRVASALSAMAGVAEDFEDEPDAYSGSRMRLSQTMRGARQMADSVVNDMPDLERQPAPRNDN